MAEQVHVGIGSNPLAEIAPAVRHPVAQRTFAELWSEFEGSREMRRIGDAAHGCPRR